MAVAVWVIVFVVIFAVGYPVAFGMFISSILYFMITKIDLATIVDLMVIQ